jgi:hypothetical protein
MTKTKQVFISYAIKDAQFAHRLADDLKRLGVQVIWRGVGRPKSQLVTGASKE